MAAIQTWFENVTLEKKNQNFVIKADSTFIDNESNLKFLLHDDKHSDIA